jgi:hypothetical protein
VDALCYIHGLSVHKISESGFGFSPKISTDVENIVENVPLSWFRSKTTHFPLVPPYDVARFQGFSSLPTLFATLSLHAPATLTGRKSIPAGRHEMIMMDASIWDQILARIETKVNRHSFYTWFRPTALLADGGSQLTIRVPNPLFKDWLTKH